MPELPEVETIARGLRRAVLGRRIVNVRLRRTDFIEKPTGVARGLCGCRIADVSRFGKFLLVHLTGARCGERFCLLVHLGMTGQLVPRRSDDPVAAHTHALFALDDGREIRYADMRRFGRMALLREDEVPERLAQLGPDALGMTEREFCTRLAARRAMVKALLLDQRVLRGMGNIYADESLWRAKVHPAGQAAGLSFRELRRLYRAIRRVLKDAIRLRGSSVSDYVDAAGERGEYQQRHRVYRREGKICFRCRTKIRRVVVAGRSSYFCPRCQRVPRRSKNTRRHHV